MTSSRFESLAWNHKFPGGEWGGGGHLNAARIPFCPRPIHKLYPARAASRARTYHTRSNPRDDSCASLRSAQFSVLRFAPHNLASHTCAHTHTHTKKHTSKQANYSLTHSCTLTHTLTQTHTHTITSRLWTRSRHITTQRTFGSHRSQFQSP